MLRILRVAFKQCSKSVLRIVQDVKDVAGGLLIAQVKDADGNVVGLRQQSK
jgi:hypothetical protein